MLSKSDNAQLGKTAPIFAALGDSMRLVLVARLSGGEPLSITRLSEGMPITRQGVTKHLHVLAEAGVVRGAKKGREQTWTLEPHSIKEAQQWLEIISKQWGETLGRLKVYVEETSG